MQPVTLQRCLAGRCKALQVNYRVGLCAGCWVQQNCMLSPAVALAEDVLTWVSMLCSRDSRRSRLL